MIQTTYTVLVAKYKAALLSEFDQAKQKQRAEEAFERFMRKILTPLN